MAAPQFVPVPPTANPRTYESPEHVPDRWTASRPADLRGRQPSGPQLGVQGPDQGYALRLAAQFRPRLRVQPGEHLEDALYGGMAVALRRASLFGRAPVIHDLVVAYTIWGFLDEFPPAELVEVRTTLFEGVGHPGHHQTELLRLVHRVPEATLRLPHTTIQIDYPRRWREFLGL